MLVPILRCTRMADALAFHTGVLDFTCASVWPESGDPAYAVLKRGGFELHLSSHAGDGALGQAVAILVADVDAIAARIRARAPAAKPNSPVHLAPLNQTWGAREFYVDDPDGNTVRFIRRDDGRSF
jgi:uncharacterized glyoxalase superfamily protein PhnB